MSSFKLKLVVYFLLLSLLPLAAAFAGFASVAKDSETRLVDTRLQAGLHAAIAAYEAVVKRYPGSGYSDNALWQAANLSLLAHERFGETGDRETAVRLLEQLRTSYPSSSLAKQVEETLASLEESAEPGQDRGARRNLRAAAPVSTTGAPAPAAPRESVQQADETTSPITVRGITRTPLPDGVRVSIEMDRELLYHREQLENPRRLFFDLRGARAAASLADRTLKYPDDIVEEIRLGRRPGNTTRVVMSMNGVESYSIFTLYNPFRVIVDFRRSGADATAATESAALPPVLPVRKASAVAQTKPVTAPVPTPPPVEKLPLQSRQAAPPALSAPALPSANSNGQFSLSRQLGLGVSRIVIDAGHGGHDPGARANGVTEAELVLDVALRLRKLLQAQPGMDVVMTRAEDVFIPLEERTAIANREGADLFLSIHANASRNIRAHGLETYFLNFASNPDAEAVAARENSASGRTMHSLPEIVRAIALNNKIDESRDFAEIIQKALVQRLTGRNAQLKDLGVKQAPFVVLIGAGMPSILAEIAFVTHKQEGQLLKTSAYRQQIAEALLDGVLRYQRSLKARNTIATREQ
jgi:N-acetylmuramoyl-L-alanine amidase